MQLIKLLNLNLQTIVLLILVPIITTITAVMTWLNYDEMYETILNGFNKKLTAISSTTGSFIDGDEHAKLAKAKEMKALSYDINNNILYGIDKKNELVEIDLESGAGKILMKFDFDIRDLTFNPKNSYLYATTDKKRIIYIDIKNRKFDRYMSVKDDFFGLTYIEKENSFFVTNEKSLFKISRKSKKIEKILEFDNRVSSLAFNSKENYLYCLEESSDEVVKIDLNTLDKSRVLFKDFPTSSTKLKTIEYFDGKIFGGETHLMVYELKHQKSEYEDFARGYRNEKDEIYLKYIEPMREIKLKTGLTYHYTQNLIYNNDEANCFYILDVHAGNVYTPIGSEDIMDEEDLLGAENVMLRSRVYISKIKPWEQWGLLKVAFAPIMNEENEVKAIAGADVDIGIIKEKTAEAIVQSLIVGIIALIIGIIASYLIAKKIIEPISKLKYGALKIAAGRYGDKVFIDTPKELSELSKVFNNMSDELKNTMSSLSLYSTNVTLQRKRDELSKELAQKRIDSDRVDIEYLNSSLRVDGYLKIEDKILFWFSNTKAKSNLKVTQKRAVINSLITSLYNFYGKDFYKEFKKIYRDEVYLFGVIDEKREIVEFLPTKLNYNLKVLILKDNRVTKVNIKHKMILSYRKNSLILGSKTIIDDFREFKLNSLINKRNQSVKKSKISEDGLLITLRGSSYDTN